MVSSSLKARLNGMAKPVIDLDEEMDTFGPPDDKAPARWHEVGEDDDEIQVIRSTPGRGGAARPIDVEAPVAGPSRPKAKPVDAMDVDVQPVAGPSNPMPVKKPKPAKPAIVTLGYLRTDLVGALSSSTGWL